MPSERSPLVTQALAAVGGAREAYRSSVVAAVEELGAALSAHRRSGDDQAGSLARELGPFAASRIDAGRLALILAKDDALSPAAAEVMETAVRVLAERAEVDDDLFIAAVSPGEDLRDAVRDAASDLGRAFGAARAAELARSERYVPDDHNDLLGRFPFRRWSAAERRVAPPLVVEVDGSDLRPAGLADFLDGACKIVLVVRSGSRGAPPAALARLITPGVLVLQTRSADELKGALTYDGPVLAAVFEGGADDVVPFVHDPRAGTLPWERLHLEEEPEAVRKRFEGRRWKERGWAEDLNHLLALASAPASAAPGSAASGAAAAGEAPAPEEPTTADRLAAWLLAQTDLSEG